MKVKADATGYPEDSDWGEETSQVHKQLGGGPTNFVATFSLPQVREILIVSPTSNSGQPHAGGAGLGGVVYYIKDGRQPEFIRQVMRTPAK